MKELLAYVVEGILGKKDFEITETENEGRVELLLDVAPEDIGLIIGKGGATIKAIRNILRVKSTLSGTPFYLSLKEEN